MSDNHNDIPFQVLTCRVVSVDAEHEKLTLSLNLIEETVTKNSNDAKWARKGQTYSATVSQDFQCRHKSSPCIISSHHLVLLSTHLPS